MKRTLLIPTALLAATLGAGAQVITVDPAIPAYQKTSGVSGSVSSIGSDSMNNLMTLWAEGFRKMYPNIKVQRQRISANPVRSGARSSWE